MNRRRALTLAAPLVTAAVATAVAVPTVSSSAAPPRPNGVQGLKVLLTNDDSVQGRDTTFGTDGKGLYELRHALCAAGADVVVVGPWGQQSGAAARETTPGRTPVPMTVQQVTPPAAYQGDCGGAASGGPVYGVCVDSSCTATSPTASPADTVLLAMQSFTKDIGFTPDLVMSGTNFGQNAGEAVNHSGTVGAVVTAHEFGVPAVAMSAEVNLQTLATPMTQAADFAVQLVSRLRDAGLLRTDLALNVNYPSVGAGERLGHPVLAVVGTGTDIGFAYTRTSAAPGTYHYGLGVGAPIPETRRDADTTALRDNDIPITVLDGDWTADGGDMGRLRGLLNKGF